MNSPNILQRLYLAKAMNEKLDGIFDHDRQLDEGAVKDMMHDYLEGLPKKAVHEIKSKHGKELSGESLSSLSSSSRKSIHGILKQHGVKPLMGSHRHGVDAVAMMFHGIHGDINEDIQTPERAREMKKKRDPKHWSTPMTYKLSREYEDLRGIDSREKVDDFTLYGKGGKVVAKRSKKWIPVKEARLDEGSYQGSQRELRGQRKGSRNLLRKALAKGDKKGAADWMENIKDADDRIKPKKKVNEARAPFIDHGAIEDRVKWGPHGIAAAKALMKKHKASGSPFSLSRADVVKAALAAKAAAAAKNKPAGN